MADTWLGALACADGSQTCSGNMPAFNPKPTSASQNSGASSGRPRIGPRSQPPVRAASSAKNANRQTMLTCDAARYSQPAARTSRFCRSSVIRKYAATVKISQAIRKCSPFATTSTRPRQSSRRFHQARPAGAERGWAASGQYPRA